MGDTRVYYTPRPDATPESELTALTAVYAYLLKNTKAARPAPEPSDRDGMYLTNNPPRDSRSGGWRA